MESTKTIEERLEALESIFLNQKEILTFKEACIYAGISRSTMYKMTSAKKIPHYKTVGLFFERADLDNWIRSHRIEASNNTHI